MLALMGGMPEPELLSPERRARILDGAGRVFAEDGYEGASMARIAQEGGVSKGTLYNYFPGKAALFSAYVAQTCSRNIPRIFTFPACETDPATTLRRIGVAMMEMMLSPIGQIVYRVVVSEAAKFPELARGFFEAGPAQSMAALSGWLARQTATGRLAVPDPDFAAEQFFALTQTRLALRCRLGIGPPPSPEAIAHVVDGAIAVFLSAYGAPAQTPAAPA